MFFYITFTVAAALYGNSHSENLAIGLCIIRCEEPVILTGKDDSMVFKCSLPHRPPATLRSIFNSCRDSLSTQIKEYDHEQEFKDANKRS